ncbi:hypothetical protein KJI95_17965 [Shewanella sp. JM162201]|uniref:Uncharacterized protein n=1 Tax=Shewanella jiangmenensis TaxID=2837387 RepID=A0ABS5V7H2_9GAMM|nr:hypothetical protein [Shewanella jiangmenensis]MBT1446384.1 hypothetical protein [Shewanella jiangmenensis]
MKLGSFFSLDGFDNGRRTGAIGLVTYTAPGLLAVLFGAGHWLWLPGLVLGAVFGLSLKRRCRDAVRPRGYLVAALAPLPLWLLCLAFGWNLAFALVCFAMGLAVTLLMAVLPSRPVKEYDEGFWHPKMPAKEPVLPRREPVLSESEDSEYASEGDEAERDDDWDERDDDRDESADDSQHQPSHRRDANAEDGYPDGRDLERRGAKALDQIRHDADDAAADAEASQYSDDRRGYGASAAHVHSDERVKPQASAYQAAREPWRPETRESARRQHRDDYDGLVYGQGLDQSLDQRWDQGPVQSQSQGLAADGGPGGRFLSAKDDDFGLVAEPRVRRTDEPRPSLRDSAGGMVSKVKGLWPFGKKADDEVYSGGNAYSGGKDGQRDEPTWQPFAGDETEPQPGAVKERTWSDAFNGEGSLEVLMEAIYFHLKRWWRFYLSGAAAALVIAGGSWLTLRISQAPDEAPKVAETETPDVQVSSVTLESGVTLKLEGEALILGWSGQITDAATLWSLASGEGDRYCATALFNNGNRYRPLTVTSANGMREARFSPLDTQAIVKDLALRGNVQLCGQAFGLKGSQAVIESNARFAALLTP